MNNLALLKKIINKNKLDLFKYKNKVYNLIPSQLHYSNSFGFQWNKYKKTQLDSHTKISLSHDRLTNNSNWKLQDLENKNVLEVGSGAGRFTEILLKTNCFLFTIDSSDAIYANNENCKEIAHNKSYFIKDSIESDTFKDHVFDYVFCYGVIQHTANPLETLRILIKKVKKNGKLSADFYRKFKVPTIYSTPKYLWRPITKRMNEITLLKIIKKYIPVYLPIDTLLKKVLGKYATYLCGLIPIPCWNYYFYGLGKELNTEWAILDTFDALSPKYDYPLSMQEIENYLKKIDNIEYKLHYGSNGIVLNLTKR